MEGETKNYLRNLLFEMAECINIINNYAAAL